MRWSAIHPNHTVPCCFVNCVLCVGEWMRVVRLYHVMTLHINCMCMICWQHVHTYFTQYKQHTKQTPYQHHTYRAKSSLNDFCAVDVRSCGTAICNSNTPALYESNKSGRPHNHARGARPAASRVGGARGNSLGMTWGLVGVCVGGCLCWWV